MWGWGAMNPTAVKEAAKINFPMDQFVGIWWSGSEDDARPAGAGRPRAISALNFHAVGAELSRRSRTSSNTWSTRARARPRRTRSARTSTIAASTIPCSSPRRSATRRRSPARKWSPARTCAAASRRSTISAGALEGDRPRGLRARRLTVSCADHNGHHSAYMQQWDGTKWVKVSDWIAADEGQGPPAARSRRQGIRLQEPAAGRSAPKPATSRS